MARAVVGAATMNACLGNVARLALEARIALALTQQAAAVAAAGERAPVRQSTSAIVAAVALLAQTAITVAPAVATAAVRARRLHAGACWSEEAAIAHALV